MPNVKGFRTQTRIGVVASLPPNKIVFDRSTTLTPFCYSYCEHLSITSRSEERLYRTRSEIAQSRLKAKKKHFVGEHDKSLLPFLNLTRKHNLTVIYLAVNGKNLNPFKIVFKNTDLRDWTFIRNYVAKVLTIDEGVQHIYTIFGVPLYSQLDFQHGCLYVALPYSEKFIAMDYMSLCGEKGKNKLKASSMCEKRILERETLKFQKKPFSSSSMFKIKKSFISKNSSSEFGSNYDVYKDGVLTNQDLFMKNSLGEDIIYIGKELDSLARNNHCRREGSKSSNMERMKEQQKQNWPLNFQRHTISSIRKSVHHRSPRDSKAMPNVVETRIQTLSKTIKRYEKKLQKLENTLTIKAKPKENYDDEEIIEHYRYNKSELTVPLENLRPEQKGPVPTTELTEWFDDLWSRGQLLLGLCYNTKKRALVVSVVRCVNLLPMDNNGLSDPFVKLQLKPDPNHKKHKTSIKWKNLNPVFNEEFAFETRPTELSTQSLYITVYDKDYGKSNDYLGGLILGGTGSKGLRLKHWMDMIRYPDHRHEQWHNLTEDLLG